NVALGLSGPQRDQERKPQGGREFGHDCVDVGVSPDPVDAAAALEVITTGAGAGGDQVPIIGPGADGLQDLPQILAGSGVLLCNLLGPVEKQASWRPLPETAEWHRAELGIDTVKVAVVILLCLLRELAELAAPAV